MALALSAFGAAGPAAGGDGSGTDNPALLRGTYTLEMAPGQISATPGNCIALNRAGIVTPECPDAAPAAVPQRRPVVAAPVPRTVKTVPVVPVRAPVVPVAAAAPPPPAVDTLPTGSIFGPETPGDDALFGDWQIALRGSSTWDGRGQRYTVVMSPEGSLTVKRASGELRLSSGFDVTYQPGSPLSVSGGNGALEIDQTVSRDLMLRTALTLDASTESVNATTSPSNEEKGALVVIGGASAEFDRQAGRTGFVLGGTLTRQYVGDTTLVGGTLSSNADRAYSAFGLKARASYKLTPILSTYVEAKADRTYYDAAAAGTGARQDNWTYQATLGLSGAWPNGLTASLYGGYGLTQYDSALLTSGGGYVIGGSLSYPVARGGELTASLDTSFTPTDSVPGASTKIAYSASLGARYLVNDWLTLRGALGGSWSIYPGAANDQYGLSAGAGFDWMFGTHTSLSADYGFGADWTPTGRGFSHTVSVGLLIHR